MTTYRTVSTEGQQLPTHRQLFVVMLLGTIVLVGALTFIPALHLAAQSGHYFAIWPFAFRRSTFLKYMVSHPVVAIAIPGAIKLKHFEDNEVLDAVACPTRRCAARWRSMGIHSVT